jgi:thiamine-phosphate pyrophosphorylase
MFSGKKGRLKAPAHAPGTAVHAADPGRTLPGGIVAVTNRHLVRSFDELAAAGRREEALALYLEQIDRICQAGPAAVVLREKTLPEADYAALASRVLGICRAHGVQLVAHTFAGAASDLGIRQIHLPLPVLRQLAGSGTGAELNPEPGLSLPASGTGTGPSPDPAHGSKLRQLAGAGISAGPDPAHGSKLRQLRGLTDLASGADQLSYFDEIGSSVHSVDEAKEAVRLGCTRLAAGHIFSTDCKPGLAPRGLGFLRSVCEAVPVPVYAIGGIDGSPEQLEAVKGCGAAGACMMSGAMKL